MTTFSVLALLLFFAMWAVGGKQGAIAFVSLGVNFALLFLTIVLVQFHLPPLPVTLVAGTIILAVTIFFGNDDDNSTTTAFYASVIVMLLLLLFIVPVEHWAQVAGFGDEDSEDLEGMSLYIGISFLKVEMCTVVLSTLGAIAEAAMAISSGLSEIETQQPTITGKRLFGDGLNVGKQIIGTTFNTLFFGFFGGFLSLFVWFVGLRYSIGEVFNDKVFVAELLMVLLSFIGVLITVPMTAAVASWRWHRQPHPSQKQPVETKVDVDE